MTLQKDDLLIDEFLARPMAQGEDGTWSELILVNNAVLRGKVFGLMKLPGTQDLHGEVMARISQDGHGGAAKFDAALKIAGGSKQPVGSLSIGFFKASISNPRLGLQWHASERQATGHWDVQAVVDAWLSVDPQISLQNGMTELRGEDAIILKDLDLVVLSYRKRQEDGRLAVFARKFEFSVFGLVGVRLAGVAMSWDYANEVVNVFSERAGITFRSGDGTSGGISVGNLELACEGKRVRIRSVNGARVDLSVPGQFDFFGAVQWQEKGDQGEESYFSLMGGLTTFGGMSVDGMLQYGAGVKRNGQRARSLVAYASRGNLNRPLLAWLWWQQAGFGAGYNRQLGNLSRHPTDAEILDKIDSLEPPDPDNWHFVADDGTYITVVGRMVFTSQPATPQTICGFVLWTAASIDTNGRVLAGGKMWLFSSQKYAENNRAFPSLVAALQLDLRTPAIRAHRNDQEGECDRGLPAT